MFEARLVQGNLLKKVKLLFGGTRSRSVLSDEFLSECGNRGFKKH